MAKRKSTAAEAVPFTPTEEPSPLGRQGEGV
jgi:hypothetical protein